MKKLLLIFSIIIVIGALIFGAWYFFLRTSDAPIARTINNILPFGSGGNSVFPLGPDDNSGDDENPLGNASSTRERLFRLSDLPVAGAVGIIKGGKATVRYTERATGHINDVDLITLATTKISNTTLPKIYEAHWTPSGNEVVYRTVRTGSETVENTLIRLRPATSTATSTPSHRIETTLLRGSIDSLVVRASTTAYVSKDTGAITISLLDGSQAETLFTSPFTDWNLYWVGTTLVAQTRPSAGVSGYAYAVTAQGLRKIIGPLPSLTIKPNTNLSQVLYSSTRGGAISLVSHFVSDGSEMQIYPATLADKCVWSTKRIGILYCGVPEAGIGTNEPDNWYQGISHYSDNIWIFDTNSNYSDLLVEPEKNFEVNIDVTNPFLTPDEDYLVFTNKNDLSLWALKLEPVR